MSERLSSAEVSPWRRRPKVIAAVAVLAVATGAFETTAIVSIVALIEGVTSGVSEREIGVAGLDLTLSQNNLAVVGALALAAMSAGQLMSAWVQARAIATWQYALQMRSIRAYLRASWSEQSTEGAGSLQNLMWLSESSAQGLKAAMTLLTAAGTVSIFMAAAFLAAPLAAGALLILGIGLMLALRPVRFRARASTREASLARGVLLNRIDEIYELAQEIRVYDADGPVQAEVGKESGVLRRDRERSGVYTSLGGILYRSLGLGFVLIGAIFASNQPDLDVARIGVAGLLILRSISYGQSIQTSWQQLQNNQPIAEQVQDALDRYEGSAPQRGATEPESLGDIEMRSLSYSYATEEQPALHEVEVLIRCGETIGVVGPSGSGKSTFVQVLLGLREPSSGTLRIGGVPAIEISDTAWSRLVAVVPQQPKLLRGTVLENICFYRPWIAVEDAKLAAADAGLDDEIAALPNGFDTVIGDGARDLSGGQRQRLGIARALAGKPQLLVLDEPTSALDAKSEARVQRALAELDPEVTVVIIAHRLATLHDCDRLLVLEDGEVRAFDSPTRVMAQNDFYRSAVEMQLSGRGEHDSRS